MSKAQVGVDSLLCVFEASEHKNDEDSKIFIQAE